MRIIAGKARGVPIKAPKGNTTRPTTDRVRESLFAILGDLSGARVLDLFAGSGALGLEALSRGAEEALFLEKDRRAVQVIKENLAKTKLAPAGRVIPVDTLRFLADPGRYLPESRENYYSLVFLDPPYASGLYQKVIGLLAESGLVAPGGILVVEQAARDEVVPEVGGFLWRRSERYGDTVISFFRRGEAEVSS